MAGFLTSGQINTLTGVLYNHFVTFTESPVNRQITVHKEPLKTFTSTGINVLAGYENFSAESNFTYTPVSQSFPAMVIYQKDQKIEPFSEALVGINKGKVFIKVKEDAANYINEGKTESVELDGMSFNVVTSQGVQNYLGLRFYRFGLESTN